MPRSQRQLRVRNPDVFLLLPLLARAHCHAHILRTKPVDHSFILGRHPEFHHRLLGAYGATNTYAPLTHTATSEEVNNFASAFAFSRPLRPALLRFLSSMAALNSSPVFFHQHKATAVIGARECARISPMSTPRSDNPFTSSNAGRITNRIR